MSEALELVEQTLFPILNWLRLMLEVASGVWIALGFAAAIVALTRAWTGPRPVRYTSIRLAFSRYLSLALEFQLAADILSTTIAPTFDELRKLAITAIIRTGLNYFLSKEMSEERERLEVAARGAAPEAIR